MSTWQILNSPLTLTLVGLVWGSLVASTITASWQRRSARQDLRIQHMRDLLKTYHGYIRLLKGDQETLAGREFDAIHAQLLSLGKMSAVIFANSEIESLWKGIAQSLATLRDLKLKKKDDSMDERLREVCSRGDTVLAAMLEEVV